MAYSNLDRDIPVTKQATTKSCEKLAIEVILKGMKWFLCLLLIGLAMFSYKQYQTIDELQGRIKESDASIADLKKQVVVSAPVRVAANPSAPTPFQSSSSLNAPGQPSASPKPGAGNWMWQHSVMDPNTPGPGGKKH